MYATLWWSTWDVQCQFACPQGYLPANNERRAGMLQRKRQEYFSLIEQYYETRHHEQHQETFRQVPPSVHWLGI